MKTPLQRLFGLLKNYPKEIRQIYGLAIFSGMINLSLPLGIQAIINYLQTGDFNTSWVILVFFVLFGIGFTGILQIFQLRIVEDILQDIFSKSAFEFSYRFPKIKTKNFDQIYSPEFANRFFDTLTIQKGLPKILIDFSLAIFQIVFGLMLLAFYSTYFLILGFIFVLLLWLIFKFTGPKGLDASLEESKHKYKMAHWLEEVARAYRTFKTNPNQNYHINRTDKINDNYLGARQKHFSILLTKFNLFVAFKVVVAATLLIFGGMLVFQQQMNIGQFVAAEIVIILIINSVEKMINLVETIYDVLTAVDKIGEVTDMSLDENNGKMPLAENIIDIDIRQLDFCFENNYHPIFENLNIKIKSGEKIILKGKSGTGKSTLLKLMAGLYQPQKGQILYNGIDIKNYKSADVHQKIRLNLPINQLFEGTIEDNISLGNTYPSAELSEILAALFLKDYINSLPLGLQTKIEATGQNLPRSIIQKIHLARVLINHPAIILMEDPLNFISVEEKRSIIEYLTASDKKYTLLVIGNNVYWDQKCDRIVELNPNYDA